MGPATALIGWLDACTAAVSHDNFHIAHRHLVMWEKTGHVRQAG